MKDEHCEMAGCDESFITSNYGVETTPRAEYEIATGQWECSPGDMMDKKGRRVRVIRNLEGLKLLRVVQDAEIGEEEIEALASGGGEVAAVLLEDRRSRGERGER